MVFIINDFQVSIKMLETSAADRRFQHLPMELVNVKTLEKKLFDRCYCMNSTKYSLEFAKKYFVTICQSTPECTF